MPAAISTRGLTKDYGAGHGLFDADLDVEEGEIFGFLGPNGAGKSTTIRLLMGLARPTKGTAAIFGLDCDRRSVEVKRMVGYLPSDPPQFGGMRGSDVVAYLGSMAGGVPDGSAQAIADRLQLDLGRRYRDYSSGNRQKLGIVLAFMRRPRLLILDEPTTGLDPLNQRTFHEMLREARDAGSTVFLSSHVLSEVEAVCDRVGIVRSGRLVRTAALADLHDLRTHRVEITFAADAPRDALAAAPGVSDLRVDGRRATCTVGGGFDGLLAALGGTSVVSLSSAEPSLEETFLTIYAGA